MCLVLLYLSYSASNAQTVSITGQLDPTQVYNTGNIVQPTVTGSGTTPWVNGVYQDSLTCWGSGGPGYCGPNAIVRPGGSINFSYGTTDLYQIQAIANILPNMGSGLKVNGYNFGFTAKNGNGWDDGRVDYLTAYVNFYAPDGSSVFYKNYDLNSKFNWTTFNFSETFNSTFAAKDLSNVRYGFVARDNNFWAGPYGPEVYNVNFSLKYSVDPCASNVLSSPTCPGYFEALAKLTPATTTNTSTNPTPVGVETTVDGVVISPIGTYGSVSMSTESTSTSEGSQPMQQAGQTTSGAISPVQQASTSQTSSTSTQTKAGDVADSGGGSKSTVSLSSVLSMIGSNQEKTTALEKSVVLAADAQAFAAGETAKSTAEKVAGDAQSQSIATSSSQSVSAALIGGVQSLATTMQTVDVAMQGNSQSNNGSSSVRQEQAGAGADGQQTISAFGSTQQQSAYSVSKQELNVSAVSPAISYSLVTPSRDAPSIQFELPHGEPIRFGLKGPVDSAIEARPPLLETNSGSQTGSSVKRDAQNNEIAGGVTVESIARQPANYAQYFTTIPDVSFYAPREIYRNQKTIDNARALRSMSSDRLHQDMVNQQYPGSR